MQQEIKPFVGWWNFQTGETDWLTETPADFAPYIPQGQVEQALYVLYQKTGCTPLQAMIKVLEQAVAAEKNASPYNT